MWLVYRELDNLLNLYYYKLLVPYVMYTTIVIVASPTIYYDKQYVMQIIAAIVTPSTLYYYKPYLVETLNIYLNFNTIVC